MRSFVLALASGTALALTGCAAAQSGTFTDPSAATNQVVGEAMAALGELPMLDFTGELGDLTGTGEPSTVAMEVTETGTAYGDATAGDHEINLMIVDGLLYVKASESFWETQGVDNPGAIDGKWTQVDPDEWFNAGLITPAEYAALLASSMEESGSLDIALPEPQELDGIMVYAIVVGSGTVYITVEAPHVVVKIDNVPVTTDPSDPGGTILSTDVAGLAASAIEDLLALLQTAVEGMTTVYDSGAGLSLAETGADFNCSNSSFTCDFDVDVTAQFSGAYQVADRVKLKLSATADGGALGTEKCSDDKTVDIGESASLSCSVSFSVPADGVEYSIYPDWTVTGVASFKPDVDGLLSLLESEFADLLA